ncbi:hypothetical protein A8924_5780 [Saccharopolyspora erythraea NRRL 2338]|nr:hypothetical protein A8924_5780 [Saccharopolyspora erythraea NRRL 2338]
MNQRPNSNRTSRFSPEWVRSSPHPRVRSGRPRPTGGRDHNQSTTRSINAGTEKVEEKSQRCPGRKNSHVPPALRFPADSREVLPGRRLGVTFTSPCGPGCAGASGRTAHRAPSARFGRATTGRLSPWLTGRPTPAEPAAPRRWAVVRRPAPGRRWPSPPSRRPAEPRAPGFATASSHGPTAPRGCACRRPRGSARRAARFRVPPPAGRANRRQTARAGAGTAHRRLRAHVGRRSPAADLRVQPSRSPSVFARRRCEPLGTALPAWAGASYGRRVMIFGADGHPGWCPTRYISDNLGKVVEGSIPSRRHRHHGFARSSRRGGARCRRPAEAGGRDLRSPAHALNRR